MEAELFHADYETDMIKLIVTSCSFANMPKNGDYATLKVV
jgi:hypothetical protein